MKSKKVKKDLERIPKILDRRSQIEDSKFKSSERISSLFSTFDDSDSSELKKEYEKRESNRKSELKVLTDSLEKTEKESRDLAQSLVNKKKYSDAEEVLKEHNRHFNPIEYDEIKEKAEKQRATRKKQITRRTVVILIIIAILVTSYISNTKKDAMYQDAIALLEQGKTEEGYKELRELDGFRDSTEMESDIFNQKWKNTSRIEVGSIVFLGYYEQDNNLANGKEPIEWEVLEVDGDRALLISKYVLDCKRFTGARWSSCLLRKWLNSTFLNNAFTSTEKDLIQKAYVIASGNPYCETRRIGRDTKDRLFLLSVSEVEQYFPESWDMICKPTDFTVARGVHYDTEKDSCDWWLRSPGEFDKYAAGLVHGSRVTSSGYIFDGCRVSNKSGVRPAMWISL